MNIECIEIKNFKNFDDLKVHFGNLNVLIGANASGKSNFVQIFRFLRDIASSGLENAISMQGGVEYLRNINIGASKDLAVKIIFKPDIGLVVNSNEKKFADINIYETSYEFSLKFNKKGMGFKIAEDKLNHKCSFYKSGNLNYDDKDKIGQGEIIINHVNSRVNVKLNQPKGLNIKEDNIYPASFNEKKLDHNELLLQTPYILVPPPLKEIFSDISIYDIDPKLPKMAAPITGKAELEEDGSNLSIILKNITSDKGKKRKLFNLVNDLLPYVGNLEVEKFGDKSLMFKLQEIYFDKQYLPASLISDGTINITALIIALFFEKQKPLMIFEEPERNIHPHLISKVVDMMKDASQNKQIIVTTHNPEFVKHTDIDDLFLLSRSEDGFSTINKPRDKKEIKTFLENEIGMEELFVQNLLGV